MSNVLRILVVDDDPLTFQQVQHSFLYDNVEVVWMPDVSMVYGFRSKIDVMLMAITPVQTYDAVASIHQKHSGAALFVLSEPNEYDAFEARNAGAIGAFMKPLSAGVIQNRLAELLPGLIPPDLDDVYVPTSAQLQARIVSFAPSSGYQNDMEGIVEELLPLVVEQVLRLQLAADTPFKQLLTNEIKRIVQSELGRQ